MLSKKVAVVDIMQCVACGACDNVCQKNAAAVHKGCYAKIDASLCIGCGKCARICPVCCINLKERAKI